GAGVGRGGGGQQQGRRQVTVGGGMVLAEQGVDGPHGFTPLHPVQGGGILLPHGGGGLGGQAEVEAQCQHRYDPRGGLGGRGRAAYKGSDGLPPLRSMSLAATWPCNRPRVLEMPLL